MNAWKGLRWLVVGLLAALAVGVRRARDVPLSPLVARGRVGSEYLQRHGVTIGEPQSGEMDDMADYARADFDPEAVHPEVRRFYEHTADYDLSYRVRWHRGFRLGASLAVRLMKRIEQLNLPGPAEPPGGTLSSRLVAIGADDDPRDGARAWIRTDESGTAVFVAIYASHVREGTRYVNIAAPLPWSNLSTILHIQHFDCDGNGGLELTTKTNTGDEGLYLVTPLGSISLPLAQTFRVCPTGDGGIRARHEMWLFGQQFLTIEYESDD